MKKNLVFILIFCSFSTFSQKELTSVFKINKDTLFIKWVPTNTNVFSSLTNNDTEIFWKEVDQLTNDPNEINFEESNPITIESLLKRAEKMSDSEFDHVVFSEFFLGSDDVDTNYLKSNFSNAILQNFLDAKSAPLLGNQFFIKGFNENRKIAVKIVNKGLQKEFIFLINPKDYEAKPIDKSSVLETQNKVMFSWNTENLNSSYVAYNMYKKKEGEKKFSKLNSLPIISFSTKDDLDKYQKFILDSNVVEGQKYFYQLKGIDFFGTELGNSKIHEIYIKKKVNASIQLDSIFAKGNSRIISCQLKLNDKNKPLNVNELVVMRSDSNFFGYQKMLSQKLTSKNFVNNRIQLKLDNYKTGDKYYYKVLAISQDLDTAESFSSYFFTFDQEPPGIATELNGTIDSVGVMRLSWIAPMDKDIKGYRIFRANAKSEDFFEITKYLHPTTNITDTLPLNTLTNDIYYYVTVVDLNYNNSKNSDTVLLVKPDTIPPVSSLLHSFKITERGIELNWYNSKSEDYFKQELIRTHLGKKEVILSLSDTIHSKYLDTSIVNGDAYQYYIKTYDRSLNVDSCKFMQVNYELGYRESIKVFNAVPDRINKGVKITWDYKKHELYTVDIYKSKNGGPFQLVKTLSPKDGIEFLDRNVTINTSYSYKIKGTLHSGIETIMSKPVIVTY